MAKFDVATVGDNCIDRFLPPVGAETVGGNALNVAIHLRRNGFRAAYFGAVGPDAYGDRMRRSLQGNGVIVDCLQTCDGVTAYTDIAFDVGGERIFVFEEFGVCRHYRPSEEDIQKLLLARHVHIGWFNDGGQLKRRLHAAGVCVSQDITVTPGADSLSIAFASVGGPLDAARTIAEKLLSDGALLAVVTRGAQGSLATDGRTYAETGIASVDIVDTTGAGDTFIAAFISAHLEGKSLQYCLDAGRDAAAITCGHLGGFPQDPIPYYREEQSTRETTS